MHPKSHRHPARSAGVAASALALAIAGLSVGTTVASADDTDGLSASAGQPVLTGSGTADKSATSGLATTPAGLKKITSSRQIPVMIKYDYDALASYTGTVSGLAATSPSVTAKALTAKPTTTQAEYLDFVSSQEAEISGRVTAAVPDADITQTYDVVYGGVAATIPGNSVRDLLKVPGVVAVQRDQLNQPLTDSSSKFIKANSAYQALGGERNAGRGIILGNIDTGVWPEHPSFADQGNLPAPPGPARACEFGDNPLTPAVDVFECNNKLIGGQEFLVTYRANQDDLVYPGTARDAEGHGSHTSSTSAGNVVKDVQTLGPKIARINGIAPGAHIIEYRALGPGGGYSSDLAAAVQQAILDGVNVMNYSISGGSSPLTDPVELAFLDAYNAGMFVAASAGNSGPGPSTADHLSPWVTTVAASTQTREFSSTLTLTGDDASTFVVKGASITAGAGPLPVALAAAAPYGDKLCTTPAPAGTFTGKIVVCERGVNGRVEKGYNVLQGGAAGMILYNPVQADIETDNHWLPAVHVADGTDMLAWVSTHTGITASFTAGEAAQGKGDVMAAFSSRGPAGTFVKPDITAPGVQILAAMTPTPGGVISGPPNPSTISDGPPGEYYQAIAGTSMSAPHIAGAAILIKAMHPSWTPGQIKSAMMTQSITQVLKEDESTPADAFDMGAGRIQVAKANDAPLTISDTAANFAALTGDPVHAIDLNIPSINAAVMPGRVTTVRTVTNVTSRPLRVTPGATQPKGTTISFRPKAATVPAGGSASFEVTIESSAPVGVQQFATVRFATPRGTAHLPVAFVPGQSDVSLLQSCAEPSVRLGESTTCTVSAVNNGFGEQQVDLTTTTNGNLRITGATGATASGGVASASATLAGARLGIPSVEPGAGPAGYLPLSLFGLPPQPVGDEDFLNFNVPTFHYNGQPYTRVGIDSNGYLVVGGMTSADNNCCELPDGPSVAPPNNVLAPFWTDLDGTGAPGVTVGSLTDGVSDWLVFQWDVNVWGTTDTRTFQVWIGTNGTQDISYAYDPTALPADPAGQAFLVGAENAGGVGDMEAVLPTEDLVVTSTDPAPGDTLSYDVTVRGRAQGPGNVHSELDASGVSGTTIVNTPVWVRR